MFPKHEIFGLSSQFRRAAVSIAANIAEGFRKRGKADKIRFLNIAQGSLEECRYYLILTKDLEYGNVSETKFLLQEVSKLLEAYSRSIQKTGVRMREPAKTLRIVWYNIKAYFKILINITEYFKAYSRSILNSEY